MEKQKNRYVCSVCNNDGSCNNDDIYECVEVWEEKNNIRKGTWMVEWLMNMKVSQQKPRVTTGDILRANEERAKK